VVDRRHELENLQRSLAMLAPGSVASLSREEAMALVSELAQVQARLSDCAMGLRYLKEESDEGRATEGLTDESGRGRSTERPMPSAGSRQ
jgi:hypothetical protein